MIGSLLRLLGRNTTALAREVGGTALVAARTVAALPRLDRREFVRSLVRFGYDSLPLGLVISIFVFFVRKREKHSKKDYESDSDSEQRAKVSTINNNYFNSNDSKGRHCYSLRENSLNKFFSLPTSLNFKVY